MMHANAFLYENLTGKSEALKQISEEETVFSQVRSQAQNINNQINLECAFMMIWKSIFIIHRK